MNNDTKAKNCNSIWAVLNHKCPHCSQGNLFQDKGSYNKTYLLFIFIVFFSCQQNTSDKQIASVTPETTLQKLINGNKRFSLLKPTHPHETIEQLQDAAKGQHPFAVILCCSDSRVSPELVFDEGIGDLFVIRTAGNIIGGLEIGSIEYAVEHLGVKLIVVMGHENCGAIKAFTEGGEITGHIKEIVDSIKMEAEIKAIPINDANRLDDCVKANVHHGIKQLIMQSGLIREKVKSKQLDLVGLRYDLDDFTVTILNQ